MTAMVVATTAGVVGVAQAQVTWIVPFNVDDLKSFCTENGGSFSFQTGNDGPRFFRCDLPGGKYVECIGGGEVVEATCYYYTPYDLPPGSGIAPPLTRPPAGYGAPPTGGKLKEPETPPIGSTGHTKTR